MEHSDTVDAYSGDVTEWPEWPGMSIVGFSEADADAAKISSDLEKAHILQRLFPKPLFVTSNNLELAKFHQKHHLLEH